MFDPNSLRAGVASGLVAYLWWGFIPLFFRQLAHCDAGEILAQRIVWALALLAAIAVAAGKLGPLWRVARSPRLLGVLAASSLLLSVNWLLYIHATVTNRVADASLGYYMLPLVNAFLATAFLGERLRPAHYPALALVALGVVVPVVWIGFVPWIALTLAVSFGLYGLVRKLAPVDSFTGLAAETALLAPVALGYIYYLHTTNRVMYGHDTTETILLTLSGVITVVPLLTFTLAIRRLPLLTLNLLQVISPTVQLILAVYWNGQDVPPAMWVALACVLAGVAVFLGDAVARRRAPRTVPVAVTAEVGD